MEGGTAQRLTRFTTGRPTASPARSPRADGAAVSHGAAAMGKTDGYRAPTAATVARLVPPRQVATAPSGVRVSPRQWKPAGPPRSALFSPLAASLPPTALSASSRLPRRTPRRRTRPRRSGGDSTDAAAAARAGASDTVAADPSSPTLLPVVPSASSPAPQAPTPGSGKRRVRRPRGARNSATGTPLAASTATPVRRNPRRRRTPDMHHAVVEAEAQPATSAAPIAVPPTRVVPAIQAEAAKTGARAGAFTQPEPLPSPGQQLADTLAEDHGGGATPPHQSPPRDEADALSLLTQDTQALETAVAMEEEKGVHAT